MNAYGVGAVFLINWLRDSLELSDITGGQIAFGLPPTDFEPPYVLVTTGQSRNYTDINATNLLATDVVFTVRGVANADDLEISGYMASLIHSAINERSGDITMENDGSYWVGPVKQDFPISFTEAAASGKVTIPLQHTGGDYRCLVQRIEE